MLTTIAILAFLALALATDDISQRRRRHQAEAEAHQAYMDCRDLIEDMYYKTQCAHWMDAYHARFYRN